MDESVYTVGELIERLEEFDEDDAVRVSDDGRTLPPEPTRRGDYVVL